MLYCTKCKNFFLNKEAIPNVKYDDNHPYIKGSCSIFTCGGDIVEIDDDIVPMIRILNDKGYNTTWSCEGHPDGITGGYYQMYIVIDMDYDKFDKLNPGIVRAEYDYFEFTRCNLGDINDNTMCGVDICIRQDVLSEFENINGVKFDPTNHDHIFEAYMRGLRMRSELMRIVKALRPNPVK